MASLPPDLTQTQAYITTSLSGALRQQQAYWVSDKWDTDGRTPLYTPPFMPPGRIRNGPDVAAVRDMRKITSGGGGIPYTVVNGSINKRTFVLGNICYDGAWQKGKIGNYTLQFRIPETNYITVGSTSDFAWMHGKGNTSAFKWTISFWMKFVGKIPGYFEGILSTREYVSAGAGIAVFYNNDSATRAIGIRIANSSGATVESLVAGSAIPDDADWHLVTLTYDQSLGSSNSKIYIDGTISVDGTKNANAPTDGNSQSALQIGRFADGSYFGGNTDLPGLLDEMAIWNIVLTDAEISQLYGRNGIGTPASNLYPSNLVSYWNFEDGPGSSKLRNYKTAISGGLDGTLKNFATGSACFNTIKRP